jgi:hypothetical protein
MSKKYTVDIIETDDGSGDAILPFPDELVKELNWEEGDLLDLQLQPDDSILITNLSKKQHVVEIQQIPNNP